MCGMEMIYHIHLTKIDLENNEHLQLTEACFMHFNAISLKCTRFKIMTVD